MLTVKNLSKRYGKKEALRRVSFTVKKGETAVIMGPSGCGKSTLVRCINRLIEPDQGEIILAGHEVHKLKEEKLLALRRNIGFVFQHFQLIQRLTALENTMLPLLFHGMPREMAEEKAIAVLSQVGLESKIRQKPVELSGGEQQRVGIARALAMEPQIMLWDEPTASLDPILVFEVVKVMEELARQRTTMLVVTHEMRFAWKAADRVFLMSGGEIVEEGPPWKVFLNPASPCGFKYKALLEENRLN
ncbi:MAG: amino acid ABC transporter ATP-binding protein [Bacillota bacterium]